MNEASGVNKAIRVGCVPLGARVQRIENSCGPGVPDVAVKWQGAWGWCECKFIGSWPKRQGTPVRFGNFTPEQRLWLRKHEEWLFVRVKSQNPEWFLFDAVTAQTIDQKNQMEWKRLATRHWVGKVDWGEWLGIIIHQEVK